MLVIAWRANAALRERVAREAERLGCTSIGLQDASSWLGVAAPCTVATERGTVVAAWSDGSVEARMERERCTLRCVAPAHRPLYVRALDGDGFVASSSLPLLVRVLEPSLSVRGLAACLLVMGLPDRVPFADLARVPAATEWREGDEITDLAPAVLHLESAIAAAVGRATTGAKKVGVLISGGLDSSAVLGALLQQKQASDIVPVTWDLGAEGGDQPHVEAWEQRLGRRIERVGVSEAAVLLESSLVLGSQPTALMTGAFERAAMRRAKLRGADVLLTGVGGDEIFAGSLQAAVRSNASWRERARRAMLAELPWGSTARQRTSELLVRPALRPLLPRVWRERSFIARARRERPPLGPLVHERLREAARLHVASVPRVPVGAAERHRELVARPFWLEMGELRAQLEAAESLPRFDIPLDSEVSRAVAVIAPHLLFDENRHRGLLRRILQKQVPQVITGRFDKADFDAFGQRLLHESSIAPRLRALSAGRRLAELGLLPAGAIERQWGASPELPSDLSVLLGWWPFLTSEAFAEQLP